MSIDIAFDKEGHGFDVEQQSSPASGAVDLNAARRAALAEIDNVGFRPLLSTLVLQS